MFVLSYPDIERRQREHRGVLPAARAGAGAAAAVRRRHAGAGRRAAGRGVGRRLRLAALSARRRLLQHLERLHVSVARRARDATLEPRASLELPHGNTDEGVK